MSGRSRLQRNTTRGIVLAAAAVAAAAAPAAAIETAPFIAGIYATDEGCLKLAAIEAGGPRNVETVPETLTAEGFQSWEGSCSFVSIKETRKGRRWVAKLKCFDGPDEWEETDTFDLDAATGRITVTLDGNSTDLIRCK